MASKVSKAAREKQVGLEENSTPFPAKQEPSANDLDQLRDILYGNQARSTDERLNRLERELDTTRQQLKDSFAIQLGELRDISQEQLANLRKELVDSAGEQNKNQSEQLLETRADFDARLKLQATEQETSKQYLLSAIEELSTEINQSIKQAQKELKDQIDSFGSEFRERLHTYKEESQKRDDELRLEFLALGAWLDDKKASRHDLGLMLAEIGQQLQQEKESSLDDPEKK